MGGDYDGRRGTQGKHEARWGCNHSSASLETARAGMVEDQLGWCFSERAILWGRGGSSSGMILEIQSWSEQAMQGWWKTI